MKYISILFISGLALVGCATRPERVQLEPGLMTATNGIPGSTYTVRIYVLAEGDSAAKVCKQFQIRLHDFEAMNPNLHPNHLLVGQEVIVAETLEK